MLVVSRVYIGLSASSQVCIPSFIGVSAVVLKVSGFTSETDRLKGCLCFRH